MSARVAGDPEGKTPAHNVMIVPHRPRRVLFSPRSPKLSLGISFASSLSTEAEACFHLGEAI